jgi:hypothetical protein
VLQEGSAALWATLHDAMHTVECINCGGDGTDLQFWITIGALVIAFLALLMNFVQFREFLRRAKARAEFDLTLSQTGCDPDGVRRTKADRCATRIAVEIKNTGKKAAGETVINAMIPRHLENLRWCGPNGEEMEEGELMADTDVVLIGPEGREYESKYLSRTLSRVGTKPNNLGHFQFYVGLTEPGEIVIPVRVGVQADEMPDEIEEYEEDLLVRVERLSHH